MKLARITNLLLLFTTAFLLLWAYSDHFDNAFHFDDAHTIENNLYIKSLNNIPAFFTDASTFSSLPTNQTYRPLVSMSLAIDYWLGGGLENRFYFHLDNFLFFVFSGLLIYLIALKLLHKRKQLYAGIVTAIYLLHPACAETVNYIIARSDIISTFFVLLSFALYLYSESSRKYHLYLITLFIGCLAKISAIMFIPLLLSYQVIFEYNSSLNPLTFFNSENEKGLAGLLKRSVIPIASMFIFYFFIRYMDAETWVSGGNSTFRYLITQPYVILHYFVTFFAPVSLSADTDWVVFESILDTRVFIGIGFVLLSVLSIILLSNKPRWKVTSFGIAWFYIALIPTSSIVPFSEVLNDHRIYFPFIGLSIAVTSTLFNIYDTLKNSISNPGAVKYSAFAGLLVLLSLGAYGTKIRNDVWDTPETLWKDVTVKSPNNGRGHMNYGLTQMAKGNYEVALKHFKITLEKLPYYAYGHINMGIVLNAMGNTLEAEEYFKKGIEYGNGFPSCHFFYARYLKEKNRSIEAIDHLQKALSLSPAHMDSRYLLMEIYSQKGKTTDLENLIASTLAMAPNDSRTLSFKSNTKKDNSALLSSKIKELESSPTAKGYLELSLHYYRVGKFKECITACEKALSIDPDFADAYNNICSAYNEMKEWKNAAEACRKAIVLNPDHQLAKNNLAWAETNLAIEQAK